MTFALEYSALRLSAALSDLDHVSALRLRGDDAFDVLDRLVAADLLVRDGQMLHTLVLEAQGEPWADIYVCRDEEDYLLLFEGPSSSELAELVRSELPSGADLSLEDLGEAYQLLSLNGPYAWEVMAEWIGPDIIGIPYLSFFHLDPRELGLSAVGGGSPGLVFRGGKTGEFGYDLLLRRELIPRVQTRLAEVGAAFDLGRAGLAALDQCALENGFWVSRHHSYRGLTPIELQLQWRVSYGKSYLGSEALRQRRSEGSTVRVVTFIADTLVACGDEVFWDDRPIGRAQTVGFSPLLKVWVGRALVERRLSHPGIGAFTVGAGRLPIRTVSAPVINNRSLYVDPRRHSYRYRQEETYPPLAPRSIAR